MERNCLPEIPSSPPPPLGDFGCANGLARSNLDPLALIAEDGEEILCCPANALLDDGSPWTNEKHNFYLTHLEVSFVTHLHRSMDLIVQNSEKNQTDKNICQKRPANVQTAAEQFTVSRNGYCPRISNERDKPFYHVSSDTHDSLSSPWINKVRCIQKDRQPLSADMHQFLKLHSMRQNKNGKVIVSPQSACSKQLSACKLDKADSLHLMKEGMGQNFVNSSYNSNNKSRAKRSKTAGADCATQEIP